MATYPTFLATLFLAGLAAGSSFAATITVDTTADADAVDGGCSLREAILAANLDARRNECPAGSGADRIVFELPGPSRIVLTSAFPAITDTLSIRGPEAGELTLDGDSTYRHFWFDSPGDDRWFALQDLTMAFGRITGALAAGGSVLVATGDTLVGTRLRFVANESDNMGGAVRLENDVTFVCTTCTFQGNVSLGATGGGAIAMADGPLCHLIDSTLFDNRAESTGSAGAIAVLRGDLILERTTLSGNTSLRHGGAISTTATTGPASITILDSTITANVADLDGDNTGDGGGLYLSGGPHPVSLTVYNSIIAGNLDGSSTTIRPDFDDSTAITLSVTASSNLIGTNREITTHFPTGDPNADGNFVGTNAVPLDPLLQALGNYGGATLTHRPQLDPMTRVVDHGQCPGTTSDQRGRGNATLGVRIVDEGSIPNHAASDGCDIGAFERGGDAVLPAEIFSDGFELGHSLRWSAEVP